VSSFASNSNDNLNDVNTKVNSGKEHASSWVGWGGILIVECGDINDAAEDVK